MNNNALGASKTRTAKPRDPDALPDGHVLLIGPSVPIMPVNDIDMPNTKCPGAGKNVVELIFAPAAAALTIIDTEDAEEPLANDGNDPDEPRIPAGKPGGGQWTTAKDTYNGKSRTMPGGAPVAQPLPMPDASFRASVISKLEALARILQQRRDGLNKTAQLAVLKFIGEEYSHWGLWDEIQDWTASTGKGGIDLGFRDPDTGLPTIGIPDSWRVSRSPLKKALTQLDFLEWDLGPANINLKSAARLSRIKSPDAINTLAEYLGRSFRKTSPSCPESVDQRNGHADPGPDHSGFRPRGPG